MRRQEVAGRKRPAAGRLGQGARSQGRLCSPKPTPPTRAFRPRQHSTTFVAGLESSTLFGERIYQEAVHRGLIRRRTVVVLTDGAAYNKTIVQTHFPKATHIIDLYHAREHLHALAVLCRATDQEEKCKDLLDQGAIGQLADRGSTVDTQTRNTSQRGAQRASSYFLKNKKLMQYAQFRRQGFFIGSGVVEAGCRDRRAAAQTARDVLVGAGCPRHTTTTLWLPLQSIRPLLG